MTFERDTIEYKNKEKEHLDILMKEIETGIIKKDVLNGRGRVIDCREAEIDYFNHINKFFENSISYRIMHDKFPEPIEKELQKIKKKKKVN